MTHALNYRSLIYMMFDPLLDSLMNRNGLWKARCTPHEDFQDIEDGTASNSLAVIVVWQILFVSPEAPALGLNRAAAPRQGLAAAQALP